MCELSVYILKGGREEPLLDEVEYVVAQGDTVRLVSIYGEVKIVSGRFSSFVNAEGRMLLEEIGP